MPSYELALIIKSALKRPELCQVLRRSCETIIEKRGIIRSMENLGHRALPYKMSAHGERHEAGSYFIINFDSGPRILDDMKEHLLRDVDIIRPNIARKEVMFERPCDKGPCLFGELPSPDHEKRVWRKKVLKKIHMTKKDRERLL